MRHKITPGILSGLIGAMVTGFVGMAIKAFGLVDRIYIDLAKVIIMSKAKTGIAATMVGWAAHLLIGSILGMAVCYFISVTSRKFWILKGWGIGISSWLFLLALGTIFRLPLFGDLPPKAAVSLFIGGTLWGLINIFVLRKITNDFQTINNSKSVGSKKIIKSRVLLLDRSTRLNKEKENIRLIKPKKLT